MPGEGLFDDLVQPAPVQTGPPDGHLFDDLLPAQPRIKQLPDGRHLDTFTGAVVEDPAFAGARADEIARRTDAAPQFVPQLADPAQSNQLLGQMPQGEHDQTLQVLSSMGLAPAAPAPAEPASQVAPTGQMTPAPVRLTDRLNDFGRHVQAGIDLGAAGVGRGLAGAAHTTLDPDVALTEADALRKGEGSFTTDATQQVVQLAPWMLGTPGLALGAAGAYGAGRQDAADAGVSPGNAELLGALQGAASLAVPAAAGKGLGRLQGLVGDAVAGGGTSLSRNVLAGAAEHAIPGAATGAGLTGVQAAGEATYDTDKAERTLESVPASLLAGAGLGALTGGAGSRGEHEQSQAGLEKQVAAEMAKARVPGPGVRNTEGHPDELAENHDAVAAEIQAREKAIAQEPTANNLEPIIDPETGMRDEFAPEATQLTRPELPEIENPEVLPDAKATTAALPAAKATPAPEEARVPQEAEAAPAAELPGHGHGGDPEHAPGAERGLTEPERPKFKQELKPGDRVRGDFTRVDEQYNTVPGADGLPQVVEGEGHVGAIDTDGSVVLHGDDGKPMGVAHADDLEHVEPAREAVPAATRPAPATKIAQRTPAGEPERAAGAERPVEPAGRETVRAPEAPAESPSEGPAPELAKARPQARREVFNPRTNDSTAITQVKVQHTGDATRDYVNVATGKDADVEGTNGILRVGRLGDGSWTVFGLNKDRVKPSQLMASGGKPPRGAYRALDETGAPIKDWKAGVASKLESFPSEEAARTAALDRWQSIKGKYRVRDRKLAAPVSEEARAQADEFTGRGEDSAGSVRSRPDEPVGEPLDNDVMRAAEEHSTAAKKLQALEDDLVTSGPEWENAQQRFADAGKLVEKLGKIQGRDDWSTAEKRAKARQAYQMLGDKGSESAREDVSKLPDETPDAEHADEHGFKAFAVGDIGKAVKESLEAVLPTGEKSPGVAAREALAPSENAVAAGIKGAAKELRQVFAPHTVDESSRKAGQIIREMGGQRARAEAQVAKVLAPARKLFAKMGTEKGREFVRRMEAGQKQDSPALDQIAASVRSVLDTPRDAIRELGTGRLQHFNENYFPHLWKDPEKAKGVFGGKRPLEGAKSFLKKRVFGTMDEGLAAGLEPITDNPIDWVVLKAGEMNRYLYAQKTLQEFQRAGMPEYVDSSERAPVGYAPVNDGVFDVYRPNKVQFQEFVDKRVYDGLNQLASSLGIQHQRKLDVRGGKQVLGASLNGQNRIESKAGADLMVVAHEIGHQIDDRFGLAKYLHDNAPAAEFKALEDLHGPDGQRFFADPSEHAADTVAAYVHAPETFKTAAPKLFDAFEKFVDSHPSIAALRDIKPALEVQKLAYEKNAGGFSKAGSYHLPESAAAVVNNYLAPGLSAKSGLFRSYLGIANALNQAQLGLSAFHLGFTSLDAAISRFALGIRYAFAGKPIPALKAIASTPLAPFTNLYRGYKLRQAYETPAGANPELVQMAQQIAEAGGRVRESNEYRMKAADKLVHTFHQALGALENGDFVKAAGKGLATIARTPFGALDALSRPIMDHLVPMQKLGVFHDMARFEVERLGPGASKDEVRAAMQKAWDSVDNRMGQLVYDNMFWNRTAKDLAMASVRSLGWNIGTFRELGGAVIDAAKVPFGGEMTHRIAYAMAMPVVTAAMGAITQYLFTGKGPEDPKDYFFPKTGRKDADGHDIRMSLPSYMKDIFEYAHAPGHTLANKVSPALAMVVQMMQNKDYYGREIRHADDPLVKQALELAKYVGGQALPFGLRNAFASRDPGASTAEKAAGFVGMPRAPAFVEKSAAEEKAQDLARERRPVGTRTQAEADKADTVRNLAGRVQKKQPGTWTEIAHDVGSGKLNDADVQSIQRRATSGSHLDYTVKGLPVEDAMDVWRVATPAERKTLTPLLQQKVWNSQTLPMETRKKYAAELKPTK